MINEDRMVDLKTILLVDDNPKDVELIIEALREHGLANRVVISRDGEDALEYLRCQGRHLRRKPGDPAVILLDIKMPKLDGIEVLQAVKEDDGLKHIPVVMLTSSKEGPDLKKSYECGANAYVVKPVDFNDFINAVKQVGMFWAMINELPPDGN